METKTTESGDKGGGFIAHESGAALIEKLVEGAVQYRASDIHLMEDAPPYIRVDEVLRPVDFPHLNHADMLEIIRAIMPERLRTRFEEKRGADFAYQYRDVVRSRVVAFYERHKLTVVLRLISLEVPNIEDLELPPILETFTELHRGMVLLTGPTGCGKSTTLAALIDRINSQRKVSIITIEDPIEYVYRNKNSVINQREVGDDVMSFNSGLVQALRQDPDVILVGEMRDLETMRTAIQAAETGQLVLSTLHTSSAVKTMERILGTFPESEHPVLLEQLAANLKVIITQELVRCAAGKGRIAALEIMIVTAEVVKLIEKHRLDDIITLMKTGRDGMQTLDLALAHLVREKKVTEDEAKHFARDVHALHRYVIGKVASTDMGGVLG